MISPRQQVLPPTEAQQVIPLRVVAGGVGVAVAVPEVVGPAAVARAAVASPLITREGDRATPSA
jgi:hypothetical protein